MNKPQPKFAAPNLKRLRLLQGWSQLELAIKSEVGEQTIIRIEKGAKAKELTLHRLANGLGVSYEELITEQSQECAA